MTTFLVAVANVSSRVTSAGAPACVVEVVTVNPAWAGAVMAKKRTARTANWRFTRETLSDGASARAGQISGW